MAGALSLPVWIVSFIGHVIQLKQTRVQKLNNKQTSFNQTYVLQSFNNYIYNKNKATLKWNKVFTFGKALVTNKIQQSTTANNM